MNSRYDKEVEVNNVIIDLITVFCILFFFTFFSTEFSVTTN